MEGIRLQKYISMCGIASRRKSEEYILAGKVIVNDEIVKELGTKVYDGDVVEFEGRKIKINNDKVYVVLNKPCGCVTTSNDQFSRKTVLDYIDIDERIYPVGRLDYNTSGLLFLTNDGELTNKITHPSSGLEKVYIATVKGKIDDRSIEILKKGLIIEDYKTLPANVSLIELNKNNSIIRIGIREGKNRQIRKMMSEIGYDVVKLMRIKIGVIELGDLPEGKWRYLSKKEIKSLKVN